jgi:hypothetical protein
LATVNLKLGRQKPNGNPARGQAPAVYPAGYLTT